MFQVFIGYDPNETVAYHVLAHSILRRASIPVSIAPLMRSQLGKLYRRARGPTESTEFSLTRFLVPALSEYRGWSMFIGCDFVVLHDVWELYELAATNYMEDVLCVQHDYVPAARVKMDGQVARRRTRDRTGPR